MTCSNGVFGACVCPTETPPAACVEGASSACTCTNGQMGAQVCEGGQLGGCVCQVPNECTPGSAQACACADGRQGNQTCNSSGSLQACVCEELTCLQLECAAQEAVCDVNCQSVMACIDRCGTASCRYHCRDNLDPLTRQRVVDMWSCARGCGFDPSVVPSQYPQIRAGERGRILYTEWAPDFGEAQREGDLDANFPFGPREETMFGRGVSAAFGDWLRDDYVVLEVFSLDLGTYRAELNAGGQAGIIINYGGGGFLSSEYTGQPLPVITVEGTRGDVVWGRFQGAACSLVSNGCVSVSGEFSAHTRR